MIKIKFNELLAILFGMFFTLFITYHTFIINFNLLPGDKGDARLLIFILEHWLNVINGHEAIFQINMFYPDKLALGYSDALFLFSLPYILFRKLGFDYFTSYQLLHVFMVSFGFLSCILMLKNALKVNLYFSIVGAVLLTSLNSMQMQIGHGQTLGFYFYPILIYLLYNFLSASNKNSLKAWSNLISYSVLLGLLFFTSYYPAWFFLFSLILFSFLYLVIASRSGVTNNFKKVYSFFKGYKQQMTISLLVFVFSLVPFLFTYIPVVFLKAERSFGEVLYFSPEFKDIINLSNYNYFWSPILNMYHFDYGKILYQIEVQMGSPIVILVLFIVFYIFLFLKIKNNTSTEKFSRDLFVFSLSTLAFVIFAMIIKYHNYSLWYIIYKFVPGATALRAVGRFMIVINMIIVVAATYVLNELYETYNENSIPNKNYLVKSILIFLTLFLIFEQVSFTPSMFNLDKSEQISFLSRYREPKNNCEAFYINNVPVSDQPYWDFQVDALMLSMSLKIPTINGYSGSMPDNVFSMIPSGIEYKIKILKWLSENNVENNICELDYSNGSFRSININNEYVSEKNKYNQIVLLNGVRNLETYSILFLASEKFLLDNNELSNLYPQYLEEHGYLDKSFGYQEGTANNWTQNDGWMGPWPCGEDQCFGIGIVGTYNEVKGVIEKYDADVTQMFFPYPEVLSSGDEISDDRKGQLLMIFPLDILQK
jgi:hypothetical protein